MARGVNKVILLGNLGNEPETQFLQSGTAVTKLSIATSESWKDKDGNKQERTEWHRVCAFGKLAEIMGEYLKKGSKVYIEGSLRTNKWKDKDGNDRYTTEIIASEMQMLDSKNSAPPETGATREEGSRQQQPTQTAMDGGAAMDNFDDDIPF